MKQTILILAYLMLFSACSGIEKTPGIIASTGTVLGIEGSQSPASTSPQATIGYKRAEFTFVPATQVGQISKLDSCGRNQNNDPMCVSKEVPIYVTPNVLTEVYFDTLFNSHLYQRMAVGETAVKQGGAAIIFAKNSSGQLDAAGSAAVQAATGFSSRNFGCDESCEILTQYLYDDEEEVIQNNLNALTTCINDRNLSAVNPADFVNLAIFENERKICIYILDIDT